MRPHMEAARVNTAWQQADLEEQMADRSMIARLWHAMPASVRPLIINPGVGTIEGNLTTDERWRAKVARLPKGSPKRKFQWAGWKAFRAREGLGLPDLDP